MEGQEMTEGKDTMGTKKLKVINLVGAPGAGKSTLMGDLFALLKRDGHQIEQIPEYAKELVWWDRHSELEDQLHVTGEQHHRLFGKKDKVDYVVTDSPIVLGLLYMPSWIPKKSFQEVVQAHLNQYDNTWIYVNRVKPFDPRGRMQSEEEAKQVDLDLRRLLNDFDIKFHCVDGREGANYVVRAHLEDIGWLSKPFEKICQ
jgi:nicotinamide riboside kinase